MVRRFEPTGAPLRNPAPERQGEPGVVPSSASRMEEAHEEHDGLCRRAVPTAKRVSPPT